MKRPQFSSPSKYQQPPVIQRIDIVVEHGFAASELEEYNGSSASADDIEETDFGTF